jgi:hypothetical protein
VTTSKVECGLCPGLVEGLRVESIPSRCDAEEQQYNSNDGQTACNTRLLLERMKWVINRGMLLSDLGIGVLLCLGISSTV